MASSLFGGAARAPQRRTPSSAGGGLNTQNIQSVKRMMNMFRAAQNPDAAIQAMAQQNPLIGNIMRVCGPGGLQNSFYRLCQEQGVDPNMVLQQLQ